MQFENRLQRAIQRGEQTRAEAGRAALARQLSAEEQKSVYSRTRLQLIERIEECLKKLSDHFPGFSYQPVMRDDAWGATVSRDDLAVSRGEGPRALYSRLEMTISAMGTAGIIELVAKGTIRNKEVFHRRNFQRLEQVDVISFYELIDLWSLEYAELYAATA
ncbi:MAG: hypothetical protein JNG89_20005 [Planctomycetaceae bacterium]|nr:hypothetical protein [Planctomycetaceae bacterium]